MTVVTEHAIARYLERVNPDLSWESARKAILQHSTAIENAAAFGACSVKLPSGHRLALDGDRVVTVYPRGHLPVRVKYGERP